MTESYSGFYPTRDEEEIRFDLLFDNIAALLQEQQPYPLPFRVFLPIEEWELDEQEAMKIKICTVDTSKGFNDYLDHYKMMIFNPETEQEFRVRRCDFFVKDGKLFAYGSDFE